MPPADAGASHEETATSQDDQTSGEAGASPWHTGVYQKLLREGYRFDFFQAVRLLEMRAQSAAGPGDLTDGSDEPVVFLPDPDLAFPAADIKMIERLDDDSDTVRMYLTFMGLYGVASPLPVYFYDKLGSEGEDPSALRHFLDIFNHRLYAFFYRAWKKYRPDQAWRGRSKAQQVERLAALTGAGTPGALSSTPIDPMRLVAFAGRLIGRTRNAEGLRALLSGLLDAQVEVVQNVARWVTLSDRPRIGANGAKLGETAAVGARILDRAGKFRVRIGPMVLQEYLGLLPGGDVSPKLRWLIRSYAPDHLDYDVELLLHSSEIPKLKLGRPECRLGLTTCVGRPPESVISRVVSYSGQAA